MSDDTSLDAIIIGGGAAGLMCAQTLGHSGLRVVVIEHANRVGKKILMSGGGRCNFTNVGTKPDNFISQNPHFCRSALAGYSPEEFVALVRKHGIAFHEKELGQLFCDDSSKQIVHMLVSECTNANAEIWTETSVTQIEKLSDGFAINSTRGMVSAKSLVIATGGLSIPSMGATGFGYDVAKQFGHTLLPTRAGLVPLTLSGSYSEQFCDLSGIAFPIQARAGSTQFDNALLITHRGLSGPAILQISSYWQLGEKLQLSLLADASQRVQEAAQRQGRLRIEEWLAQVLPKRFAQRLCEVYNELISPQKKLAECGKTSLQQLTQVLSHWPIIPSGTEGYRTAEVTLGGVDTKEINQTSMESKRVSGFYFIGEVLDVTGHLGGYNFQWAWASAVAAARAISSSPH
jgi:predicted Rossmann fold flavoprotein